MGKNSQIIQSYTPERCAFILCDNKKKAKELIALIIEVRKIGLTNYKEIEVIND